MNSTMIVLKAKNYLDGQIEDDLMGRACDTYGAKINPYKLVVGKAEGKRLPARPKE